MKRIIYLLFTLLYISSAFCQDKIVSSTAYEGNNIIYFFNKVSDSCYLRIDTLSSKIIYRRLDLITIDSSKVSEIYNMRFIYNELDFSNNIIVSKSFFVSYWHSDWFEGHLYEGKVYTQYNERLNLKRKIFRITKKYLIKRIFTYKTTHVS